MNVAEMLLVALAGGIGAAARYALDAGFARWLARPSAWGSFTVNLTGALAVGLLWPLGHALSIHPTLHTTLAVGFLGAYTTFSTWMVQAAQQLHRGQYAPAIANLLGSTLLGLLAVALGLTTGYFLLSFV